MRAAAPDLRDDILPRLRAYRTPTLYDAIERFNLRPKNEGYTDETVRCISPSLGAFVGYAWTGKIVGDKPARADEIVVTWQAVWEDVVAASRPSIAVVED